MESFETAPLACPQRHLCIGPIPKFKFAKASYDSTFFCQTKHGLECNPNVNVLVGFLHDLNHPTFLLAPKGYGNGPCGEPWFRLRYKYTNSEVSLISFPRQKLNGTWRPSVAMLVSLLEIRLEGNNISGTFPIHCNELKSWTLLDLGDGRL